MFQRANLNRDGLCNGLRILWNHRFPQCFLQGAATAAGFRVSFETAIVYGSIDPISWTVRSVFNFTFIIHISHLLCLCLCVHAFVPWHLCWRQRRVFVGAGDETEVITEGSTFNCWVVALASGRQVSVTRTQTCGVQLLNPNLLTTNQGTPKLIF